MLGPVAGRAGVSRARPAGLLPLSYLEARGCLRLTGTGASADPDPVQVRAEELGGRVLLARTQDRTRLSEEEPPDDVVAVERSLTEVVWAAPTLRALATTTSLRAAAESVPLHHSTLQRQVRLLEERLGWSLTDADGRFRLQLALALHRLRANSVDPGLW